MHLVVCVVHTVVVALVCTVVYTHRQSNRGVFYCVYSTYILGNETHVVCCNDLERYM